MRNCLSWPYFVAVLTILVISAGAQAFADSLVISYAPNRPHGSLVLGYEGLIPSGGRWSAFSIGVSGVDMQRALATLFPDDDCYDSTSGVFTDYHYGPRHTSIERGSYSALYLNGIGSKKLRLVFGAGLVGQTTYVDNVSDINGSQWRNKTLLKFKPEALVECRISIGRSASLSVGYGINNGLGIAYRF